MPRIKASPTLNSALAPYREALRRLWEGDLTLENLSKTAGLLRQGATSRAFSYDVQENLYAAAQVMDKATRIAQVSIGLSRGQLGTNVRQQIGRYIGRAAVEIGAPPPGFIPVRTRRRSRR